MNRTLARFVNPNSQTVAAGGNILFTSTTISTSCIKYLSDGSIQLKCPGTYMIYANFNVAPTGTAASVAMYEGTTQVPGAIGTTVVTATDTAAISFNAIVTAQPGTAGTYATITFNNLNAGSITNANVIIEKVD